MKQLLSFAVLITFAILAAGTGDSGSAPSSPSASSPPSSGAPRIAIVNESAANPNDIQQAREFLDRLPEACGGSSASVNGQGTVTIRLRCANASDAMAGTVKIKDGVVTEIK